LHMVSFITLPAMVGLMVLSEPLVRIFFEKGHFTSAETIATVNAMMFYSVGLWSASLQRIVVPAYYSFQNTHFPAFVSFSSLGILASLCFLFIKPLAHSGLALAVAFSSIFQISVLLWFFRKKYVCFQWSELFLPQLKHLGAALCMGVILYAIQTEFQWKGEGRFSTNCLILLCLVSGGIIFYTLLSYFLKTQEFLYLHQRLLRRKLSR
ncbi:MAG: polysaccharide biosynthesis C-terminal domain-containing protein, partial [Deltaproteobacteria bacterium]|nr:polysaccharide biosynthesis C-terminal domain-containing protein [Deltaproteobacteria bacterium]